MAYNTTFSEMKLGEVPSGLASAYEIAVTILAEKESLERAGTRFGTLVLAKLKDNLDVVTRFVQAVESVIHQDYSDYFTHGPRNYKDIGVNNVTLDRVSLGALGWLLINRVDFATRKLFHRDNRDQWDPNTVTYYGLSSADLTWFADEILAVWDRLDEEFAKSFSAAIKEASEKSKQEAMERKQEAEKRKSERKFPPSNRKQFHKSKPAMTATSKQVVKSETVSSPPKQILKPVAPRLPPSPVENVWEKRKQLAEQKLSTEPSDQ